MSWICENCSSVNEDSAKTCFVCGCKKPKKVKRSSRHSAGVTPPARPMLSKGEKVYRAILITLLTMLILGMIATAVFAVLSIITLVQNGQILNLITNLLTLFERLIGCLASLFNNGQIVAFVDLVVKKIVNLFSFSIGDLFTHLWDKIMDIWQNIISFFSLLGGKFTSLYQNVVAFFTAIFSRF